MPIQIDKILSAGLFTMDGEKVLDLTNTWCYDSFETVDVDATNNFRMNIPDEMSFGIKWSIGAVRSLNKAAYGWKASGPIRKRILRRLWNKCEVKS